MLDGGVLLAPGWTATAAGNGWVLTQRELRLRLSLRGPPGLRLFAEERPYHPENGLEIQTTRLSWQLDGDLPVDIVLLAEED